MKIPNEDTYFLDRDLAYQIALAHNTFATHDGKIVEQICYYDGQLIDQAPNNLIHVPVEKFSNYFQAHLQRIPTRIEPSLGDIRDDSGTIHQRLSAILEAVQGLYKNGYLNKDAA